MAITKPKRQSQIEAFAAAAPDAQPAAKLRGRKKLFAMTLPPDLMAAVDRLAEREDRSRAKMVEIILKRAVQEAEHSV